MNTDMERDDTYVAQLYQVFKSCDLYGTGLLGEDELFNLCMRLQLDDNQTNYIISNLIGNDIIAKINFDDFKEIFVSLLTQSEANSEEQYSRIDSNDVKGVSYNSHQKNNSFNKNNDTNIEQYLRSIWERLGVGKNGYLNIDELYSVCEYIGMIGINSEVIEQLFDKLDYDQDGKVSFDEFLDGLFQYDSAICDNSALKHYNSGDNLVQLHSETPHLATASDTDISNLNCNHLNGSDTSLHENNSDLIREHNNSFYTSSPYLITLDPDRSGYIEAENVIKLWESLGFTNSEQLLTNLGFNPKSKVNTQELSAVLEEKLCAPNTSSTELFQVSLATFQNELTQTKINYEHIRDERDRLRINICEANTRADLLAQEVDDQNAKLEASSQTRLILLEKKYSEQIRGLQQELQRERESMDRQSLHLRQDIAKELSSVQEQSSQLRQKIETLEQENKRLENEVQTMNSKHLELQRVYLDNNKRIDESDRLTKKLTELESMQVLVREQHNEEIDSLKAQNKELQDRNDELVLQIENLKQEIQQISIQRQNTSSKKNKKHTNQRRSQSWLLDYIQTVSVEELEDTHCKSVAFNLKRRGNDSSSSDETEDDKIH